MVYNVLLYTLCLVIMAHKTQQTWSNIYLRSKIIVGSLSLLRQNF